MIGFCTSTGILLFHTLVYFQRLVGWRRVDLGDLSGSAVYFFLRESV